MQAASRELADSGAHWFSENVLEGTIWQLLARKNRTCVGRWDYFSRNET